MSAFPTSHFGSTRDTFFRPLVQQIHDCWAELKADSKKKPVDQAVWTQASLGEEENEGLWYTSLRNTLTVSVHGETPQTSRPTTPQWRVGMSTKIETPKHHEIVSLERRQSAASKWLCTCTCGAGASFSLLQHANQGSNRNMRGPEIWSQNL